MPERPARNASLRRPSVLAWLRLSRISNRIMQAGATQLAAHNLTAAQFDVLSHIGADEGIPQVNLAQRLLVTQGNITQMLDKMEERDLIRRVREGRTNRLYLTPAGRRLFNEVVPPHEDLIAAQFDSLSSEEQQQLLRLLSKLDHSAR